MIKSLVIYLLPGLFRLSLLYTTSYRPLLINEIIVYRIRRIIYRYAFSSPRNSLRLSEFLSRANSIILIIKGYEVYTVFVTIFITTIGLLSK